MQAVASVIAPKTLGKATWVLKMMYATTSPLIILVLWSMYLLHKCGWLRDVWKRLTALLM